MSETVVAIKLAKERYPSKDNLFRPNVAYPEYLWQEISEDENFVYDGVRQSFFLMGFDKSNYGKKNWNPLGEIIQPGNNVLIKPNMVMDINRCKTGDEKSLYTNPSVVAAVIDYVVIALKGRGKIVVGDAPMQECDFENLIINSGYSKLIEFYQKKGIDIILADFRELTSVVKNGIHISSINKKAKGKVIDLGKYSDFYGESPTTIKKMRITNYDPNIMPQHHNEYKHEYYISEYALQADVIINMPKPKSHRKAGMTAALKNYVGLNVRKEYLPHHTKGAKDNGGDEYDKKNIIHDIRSLILDRKNIYIKKNNRFIGHICRVLIKICSILLKLEKKDRYGEGSWYGNRTISRTVVDINRIIYYADKNGRLNDEKQRKMLIIGDMIISGEGEGPVLPTNKKCGTIVVGDNPIVFDKTVATLMGFDYKKIPTITNAEKEHKKYNLFGDKLVPEIISNMEAFNGKSIEEICYDSTFKFAATSGWKNHIEL